MRILITGACGFLGRHLRQTTFKGALNVRLADRVECDIDRSQQSVLHGDLSDPRYCRALVKRTNPQAVFHLAGLIGSHSPKALLSAHALCTMNLIEALTARPWRGIFVLASSGAVYGAEGRRRIQEGALLEPITPYGASKVAQEMTALSGLSPEATLIRARLFNLIGPGQQEALFASAVAKQIAFAELGAPAVVRVGNLASRRDFIDVRDAARALILLVKKNPPAGAYNVCTERSHSMRDVLDLLLEMSKVRMQVKRDPRRIRAGDIPEQRGDAGKIYKAVGWQAKIGFKQSLRDLLEDWRTRVRKGSE